MLALLSVTGTLLSLNCFAETLSDDIEVIQVYAQKRLQSIDQVPVSVTHIDGDALQQARVKDTTGLAQFAPNLKITQNTAEGTPPAISIRGIGSLDYNTSTSSPVGIYFDDATGVSANSQLATLYDIESVEVLRGPQGTLFGRNNTGGSVLIRSAQPVFTQQGFVNAAIGERHSRSLTGAFNQPLSDTWAARVAMSYQQYDYSTHNTYEPASQPDMRQLSARLSVKGQWQRAELIARINMSDWDGTVMPPGSLGIYKTDGQPGELCSPSELGQLNCVDAFGLNSGSSDYYAVAVNTDVNGGSPHTTDSKGANVQFRYQLNDTLELVSITAADKLDRKHYYNSDANILSLGEGGQNVLTHTYSQELRLEYNQDAITALGGLYWLKEELSQDNFFDLLGSFRQHPQLYSQAATFFYDNQIDTRTLATFAQADYLLTPDLTITAGLRRNWDKVDYHAVGDINVALAADGVSSVTVPGWDVRGKNSDSEYSGKLAATYQVSEQMHVFASFNRGYKGGGYNGALITSEAEAINSDYGPETLNAWEAGLRWALMPSVRLHASGFYYAYRDQQVFMNQQALDPGNPPLQLLSNVGKSTIYGAEAELMAKLDTGLEMNLSLGYLPKANLKSFVDANGALHENTRLPMSSKWNIGLNLSYTHSVGTGEMIASLRGDYQSGFYFDQNESAYTRQKAYSLFDTDLKYQQDQWWLSLWGKNIFDKKYSQMRFDLSSLFGMLQDYKGEARQIGVAAGYRF